MKANIIKKFDEMESGRMRLFQMIQNQGDDILNKKPAPGKWSPIQILHHLILAESGTYQYVKKKTGNPDQLEKSGWREKLNYIILSIFLKAPLKWKAPKVASDLPEQDSLSHTADLYSALRSEWKQLIEEMPEDISDKKIFRHPIAGRMNLEDTLGFMELHAKRHFNQIREILRG